MPTEEASLSAPDPGAGTPSPTPGKSLGLGLAARPTSLRGADLHRTTGTDGSSLTVHLLFFDQSCFDPEDFAATGISCPANIARSVRKRQAEFLFGRLAARLTLNDVAPTTSAAEVAIGPTREPIWPPGIIGSISHCDRVAAAIAEPQGTRRGIGIDLERVASAKTCEALLTTVVDDKETALLRQLAGERWPIETLLTLVFSAKESLFKGAFPVVGRYFHFSAAQLVALDQERRLLRFSLTETLCDEFRQAQCVDIGFDFIEPDLPLTHFVW